MIVVWIVVAVFLAALFSLMRLNPQRRCLRTHRWCSLYLAKPVRVLNKCNGMVAEDAGLFNCDACGQLAFSPNLITGKYIPLPHPFYVVVDEDNKEVTK